MGVKDNKVIFIGTLYGVDCQVAEHISCKITMEVFENRNPCMLVRNDLIGVPNSFWEVLPMNIGYYFHVLCCCKGHVASVQNLKNV